MERKSALAGWEDGDGVFDERVGTVGLDGVRERGGEVEGEEVDEVSDEAKGGVNCVGVGGDGGEFGVVVV